MVRKHCAPTRCVPKNLLFEPSFLQSNPRNSTCRRQGLKRAQWCQLGPKSRILKEEEHCGLL